MYEFVTFKEKVKIYFSLIVSTLSYLLKKQDVISKQGGGNSLKYVVKQTGCINQTGWNV